MGDWEKEGQAQDLPLRGLGDGRDGLTATGWGVGRGVCHTPLQMSMEERWGRIYLEGFKILNPYGDG